MIPVILHIDRRRELGHRDPMIYGHFIEHFHRQIYGGVYDPGGWRTPIHSAPTST